MRPQIHTPHIRELFFGQENVYGGEWGRGTLPV